jgi:hypothetical protein
MGVSQAEFNFAKGWFTSLDVAAANVADDITVIGVSVQGIRGSQNETRRSAPTLYRLLADVSGLRSGLPVTWVVSPQADQVEHVNIFRPSMCALTGTPLPYICWGVSSSTWRSAPEGHRTLAAYLQVATGVLGVVNLSSPAR